MSNLHKSIRHLIFVIRQMSDVRGRQVEYCNILLIDQSEKDNGKKI